MIEDLGKLGTMVGNQMVAVLGRRTSMKWKIKIKGAGSSLVHRRKAFLTHPSRNPIEIGEAYVHRNSGWHGGGQTWMFKPIENPLDLHISSGSGSSKKELLSQLHDLLEVSDNEIIRKHA